VFVLTPDRLMCSVETPLGILVTVAVILATDPSIADVVDVNVLAGSVANPWVQLWSFSGGVGRESVVFND
jgi:hypothetical protein